MSMAGTVVSPGGGMAVAFAMILFTWLIRLAGLAVSVYIVVLLVRALKKYLDDSGSRTQDAQLKKSLGETLKKYRTEKGMTQEFVAERLGVSRQAVSKWEKGPRIPVHPICLRWRNCSKFPRKNY